MYKRQVHDPTEIARFAEVLPVIVGEFVFLVLIPVSYTHLDAPLQGSEQILRRAVGYLPHIVEIDRQHGGGFAH